MSKKLCFLMSFVLVLTLSGAIQAVPIDDPSYNLSFEWHWPDVNGTAQIYGHTGIGAVPPNPNDVNQGVWNWLSTGSGFQGVDVFCPEAYDTPTHCHTWPATDGICYIYLQHSGNGISQILDESDANAVITAGRMYTMKFDGMDFGTTGVTAHLYSASLDPIASESFILPEIFQAIENCNAGQGQLDPGDTCPAWHRDLTVSFIALEGLHLGETLSVRLEANGGGGSYAFMDNVRLEWKWLTMAYYPKPEDGAEDVPRTVTLSWWPGLWARDVNGHEVYFGTDEAAVEAADRFDLSGIFRGAQDRDVNSYTPPECPLDHAKTYYWRIDEVNESYAGPPAAAPDANGRWKGEVWSFEVTGFATNPNPANGAEDVPVFTNLSWTPGTNSDKHDVYFGTDEDAVTDANIDVNFGVYLGRQDANVFSNSNLVPALELGKTYYWRIDEVNAAISLLVKGKVWSFTVAGYLVVEDFDSYASDEKLWDVWLDDWTGGINALIYLENGALDANLVRDGNSMEYQYYDNTSPYYSEACANTADLEIAKWGPDWTKGNFEALALYFHGKVGNDAKERMYVALTDGDNPKRTAKVIYHDSNDIEQYWKHYQEWNIDLQEFVDNNNVNLANVWRITIGFGDGTNPSPASGRGSVYFDDIRLYPSRCVPAYASATGSFRYLDHYKAEGDFESDCKNDYFDLWSMGSDWLMSSYGNATAVSPSATGLAGYWMMDDNVGTGSAAVKLKVTDSSVNLKHGVLHDDNKDPGQSTKAHHTTGKIGTGALTFDGVDDYVEIPVLNLNTNTMTISAWVKPDGLQTIYSGIVGNELDGVSLGFSSAATYAPLEWSPNNELCYFWTGWAWDAHSGLIVPDDGRWSFVALVVEPTKGTLYLYDGISMRSSVNYEDHAVKAFSTTSYIGGAVKGAIDDVHIYKNRALSPGEILGLAGLSGTHYLELEPWRPDANNDDKIDLKDFAVTADNWLEEILWPFE